MCVCACASVSNACSKRACVRVGVRARVSVSKECSKLVCVCACARFLYSGFVY